MNSHRARRLRTALVSFVLLFGLLGSYALLETARDSLFLSHLPASKLPWAYLATAAALLVATRLLPAPSKEGGRRYTSISLLAVAGVVLGWYLHGPRTTLGLQVFYPTVGVAGSLMMVQVWTLIGAQFNIREARRLFALIAAGGALGAIVGSAVATRLMSGHEPRLLIGLASVVLAVTAAGPWLLPAPALAPSAPESTAPLSRVYRTQYARRILWMVALITIATTLGDFFFKSQVAANVPTAQLGWFFSIYQLGVNTVGLLMQVVVAPILFRFVPANRTVMALPALFAVAAAGAALAPGLGASLALKGVDGALRNSVHRTSTEVLYLPLPFSLRGRLKPLIDGVGQRMAQALASLLALGGALIGATSMHFALAITVLSVLCLVVAWGVRRQYVDAFRDQLREGKLDGHAELPQLDLQSVESLLAMLSSANDGHVLAALDALALQGKAKLIPSLLLYHPSGEVAGRVLSILTAAGRRDFMPLTERLLAHPDAGLRAAAGQARAELISDEDDLRRMVDDIRPEVQASGLVGLFRIGAERESDRRRLQRIVQQGTPEARLAAVRAIARMPRPALTPLLAAIADASDPELRIALAAALQTCGDSRGLSLALELLAVRQVRAAARQIFLDSGAEGLTFLAQALRDPRLDRDVRRHIPRSISRFGSERAAAILLEALVQREGDGVARYKMLRGLGRMMTNNPKLRLDKQAVELLARQAIERGHRLRGWRTALEAEPPSDRRDVLQALLQRKERMVIERVFRFLALLHPGQDLQHVHDGLRDADPSRRATSRELLEYLVDPSLLAPVISLIGRAGRGPRLDDCLRQMLEDDSAAVRALASEYAQMEVRHAAQSA